MPIHGRLGATVEPDGVRFRIWAPKPARMEVIVLDGQEMALQKSGDGYFTGIVPGARDGQRYWLRLDGDSLRPDPASRYQPEGPMGPSQIVDPSRYTWSDGNWRGIRQTARSVLYELHLGTFTPEGTWSAAMHELQRLADLGIDVLEVMPVAEFPGRFGWGYDGVDLFAPHHLYGMPDDARRFVDQAHRLGLAVILDVVYNHFGPEGCFLRDFSDAYFTDKYENEWGDALNFDGPDSGPVRELVLQNAAYWIEEFHFDGLRLDATQAIHDASPEHIVLAVCARARAAAGDRAVLVVAENEQQDASLLRDRQPSLDGCDALWNDDYHHAALVALTGRREAYYTDYDGSAREFVSMARHGFLYQGQWYSWQKKRRGTSTLGLRSSAFVTFLENHDQVANSGAGLRPHQEADAGTWRALTAHLLLGPGLPMLFQGQEYGTTSPFRYFADYGEPLAGQIAKGRGEFLAQFPSLATAAGEGRLARPSDPATFTGCKLDPRERDQKAAAGELHRSLLALRRTDPVLSAIGTPEWTMEASTLGEEAFLLRHAAGAGTRLVVVNLGRDLPLRTANDPLLAVSAGESWTVLWSSDDPQVGGGGRRPLPEPPQWILPARSAYVLGIG